MVSRPLASLLTSAIVSLRSSGWISWTKGDFQQFHRGVAQDPLEGGIDQLEIAVDPCDAEHVQGIIEEPIQVVAGILPGGSLAHRHAAEGAVAGALGQRRLAS